MALHWRALHILMLVLGTTSRGRASDVPFEASFSDLEMIGSSNYTHFWMPAPLTLSSRLPSARLMAHVDLYVNHSMHGFSTLANSRGVNIAAYVHPPFATIALNLVFGSEISATGRSRVLLR